MKKNEYLKIDANMILVLRDKDGNIKEERRVHNTTTNAGKYGIADQLLASPSLAKVGWCAVGTGTPQATLLQTEVARVAFTSKTRSNGVVTMVTDYAAGVGTGALTEAGLFNVVTANTVDMWCSASFGVVTKGANDTMSITWTITVG